MNIFRPAPHYIVRKPCLNRSVSCKVCPPAPTFTQHHVRKTRNTSWRDHGTGLGGCIGRESSWGGHRRHWHWHWHGRCWHFNLRCSWRKVQHACDGGLVQDFHDLSAPRQDWPQGAVVLLRARAHTHTHTNTVTHAHARTHARSPCHSCRVALLHTMHRTFPHHRFLNQPRSAHGATCC